MSGEMSKQKKLPDGKAEPGQEKTGDKGTEKGGPEYIYLSYSLKQQPIVLKIKEALEKKGFKVKMDVEQRSGPILDQIANAVESAAVILVCFSSSYKSSDNCRLEAEYAFNRRKFIIPVCVEAGFRPIGWLGHLLGSKLSFNFGKEELFEKSMETLVVELRESVSYSSIDLPENIQSLSAEKVQLYLESMRAGVGIHRHIRVVLIGYEGVGKTTMCQRIIGDKKDLDKIEPTDGAILYIQRFLVDNEKWVLIKEDLADQTLKKLTDVVASYKIDANTTAEASEGDEKAPEDVEEPARC